MENFIYPGLLSSVALLVYYFTLLQAGLARAKYGIKAPSHDGPEEYVRKVRVHHNTIEHLVLFYLVYGYFHLQLILFGHLLLALYGQ